MRSLLNRPFWAKLLAIVTIGTAAVVFAESGTHYTMTITPMWKLNNETDYPPFLNHPPQVNAGADQTITLPNVANLQGTVTDDSLPNPPAAVTQNWTKVSGPGAVTFGDVTARTTTATFAVAGIYVLKLTASDSALSASDDVQITVNSAGVVNQAPQVNAGADQTITLPATANLNATVTDDGLPNPPAAVTQSWAKVSGPGTVTFGDVTARTTTATFAVAGIYVLKLTASDSALSASDDVQITVNSAGVVNQAPQVNAGADQTITLPATANLSATVTDDGLPNPPAAVTQIWAKVSGPGTVTFGNVNARNTTATFAVEGTYVLRLTANDGVLSNTDYVMIFVNSSFTINADVDNPSGIPGQSFKLSANLVGQSQSPVQSWLWSLDDGREISGKSISVSFNQPGFFVATVTATLADTSKAIATTGMAVFDPNTNTVPELRLPSIMGDVNEDGIVTPADINLIRNHALDQGLLPELPTTIRFSADIDLDDAITETDANLLETAFSDGQHLPSLLYPSSGAPGSTVRLISPNLLDSSSLIEIEVGDSDVVQRPVRLLPGYANFVIPLDATNQGSVAVSPGTVSVRVNRDGVLVQTLNFSVTAPQHLPNNPKQEIESFFNSFLSLMDANQAAFSDALDDYGLTSSDKELLIQIMAASRQEVNAGFEQMRILLQQNGGDDLARMFLTFANSRGGLPTDYSAKVLACTQQLKGLHLKASGDDAIRAICILKSANDLLNIGSTWVGFGCDALLVAGIPAVSIFSIGTLTPATILGWVSTCGLIEGGLTLTDVVTSFIKDVNPDLKLTASRISQEPSDKFNISANVGIIGGEDICSFAADQSQESLTKLLIKKVVDFVVKKKIHLTVIAIALQTLNKNGSQLFHDLLTKYLGIVIENIPGLSGISNVFKDFAGHCCDTNKVPKPIELNSVLTPNPPPVGRLQFGFPDGHAEYTCPTDGQAININFQADKQLCKELKRESVHVQCSSHNLSLSPPSVSLSGTGGQSGSNSNALQVSNSQDAAANYTLQWNPLNPNVFLSPVSGTVPSQGSTPITATYSCPIQGGDWNGKIELHNSDGTVEDAADVSLSCTCETPECECPNPPCCTNPPCKDGESNGDPHLTTFDSLAYDFQGVGEFIFAKSLIPNDTFEVQVRTKPWENRTDVAITQAAAMKVATDRVSFYNKINPLTHINGVPKALAEGETVTLPSGGSVNRSGDLYSVLWPDGSYVKVIDNNWGFLVKTTITQDKQGKLTGLMGNADNNRENDVIIKNGANLGTQFAFTDLYPGYADSWRITQQESLFDYAPGETTETFTDRNFPRVEADADDLTAAARAAAEQICRAAGITDPILLENCILDVALTGESAFAQTGLQVPAGTVTVTPPPPPTINDPGFGQFKGSVTNAVTNLFMNTGSVDLTVDGTPLTGVTTKPITNGIYETDVVPIGNGYRLDIQANGYINEKIFALTAVDRQLVQVEPVKLVPSTANGTGTVTGHIANALNNNNVANVNILARRYINQRGGNPIVNAVTNTDGNFTLNGLTAGNYTLEVNGTGFIANYLTAVVIGNQTTNVTATISPELGASQFRIVLTWGENPSDLDSHLTGPNGEGGRFHVYYGNRGNSNLEIAPYAYLDRDDTSSFGPETITIGQLISGDVYRYSVEHYSGSSTLALSGAKVEVYGNNNRLLTTLNVPNQEGTLWTVFEINPAGVIVPVNQITDGTNPYSAPAGQRTGNQQGDLVTDYWQMLFHKKD